MDISEAADRLANLLAVSDVELARLDLDDLLVKLLDRVRSALVTDTAAVLLRDPGTDYVVARAACGLEEEVRQGVRIALGHGFAGSIAARKEPVRLTRVDATTVTNPILWETGIQVMLGVPLLSGTDVIGVLHVGRLSAEPFTDDDVEVLQMAGERIASAIVASRLAISAAAANLLERSLQPARLPMLPGLQFAARYVPAEGRAVGGDWYDAFALPSGNLWLVTGDVAGHGIDAAVVMGRVRSALRAYALLDESPERVLELTDRKVKHFEIGTMVTLACAVAQPPYDRVRICTAGHAPPVLVAPGEPGRLIELPVGPPLGVVAGATRTAADLDWPAGAVLLFYTDGLVERRDADLGVRLDQLARLTPAEHPEIVCARVMHEMIRNDVVHDDVAVLAARRLP
ncbi:MAG TPA: GAF domain-containing SpoIIE family protein phosphatase [Jatrophihabitans sp.]|nr:GAF domain-containing SpoIIE family protein phosphatase [Jatrophihabitans sp.]